VHGHRDHAGGRVTADRGVHLQRLRQGADEKHPVCGVTPPAGQVEDLPGEVPAGEDVEQGGDQRGRHGHEQVDLRAERHEQTSATTVVMEHPLNRRCRCRVAPVVCTRAPEHDQPAQRQRQVGHRVEERDAALEHVEPGDGLTEQRDGGEAGEHRGAEVAQRQQAHGGRCQVDTFVYDPTASAARRCAADLGCRRNPPVVAPRLDLEPRGRRLVVTSGVSSRRVEHWTVRCRANSPLRLPWRVGYDG
jgi:hypothetical protein